MGDNMLFTQLLRPEELVTLNENQIDILEDHIMAEILKRDDLRKQLEQRTREVLDSFKLKAPKK